MTKVKLKDSYPNIEIDLGMGNILRKGDIKDIPETYELKQAIDMGHIEEVKEKKEIQRRPRSLGFCRAKKCKKCTSCS